MVICLSLAAVASAGASLTSADQYLIDPPDTGQYFTGSVIGQGPDVLGYTDFYTGDTSISVVETGLGYAGVSSAGGALQALPYGRAGRTLSTAYDGSTTGTIYFGFLLQLADTDNGQIPWYSAIELFSGSSRAFQLGASGAGDFGTTTNFGMRVNDNNSLRTALDAANTDVNLFVVRIDFSADPNSDSISVYQNPGDLFSEGGNTPVATLGGFDLAFDSIWLSSFNNNGGGITADEVRIGSDFADATAPIPEPGTLAMLMLGGAAATFLRRRKATCS